MSTTNDEQAKYGDQPKIIGAPVDQKTVGEMKEEMIEAIDRLSEQVKPKEREPMLSDADVERIIPQEEYVAYEEWTWMVHGGKFIRDHYESLITTGKLRVVEEVEWDMSIPRDPCCPFCNYGWEGLGDVHLDRDFKFYPCCGNKIKR